MSKLFYEQLGRMTWRQTKRKFRRQASDSTVRAVAVGAVAVGVIAVGAVLARSHAPAE